jgi:serine phosphatase RsbU (regulator of sigma subunit)
MRIACAGHMPPAVVAPDRPPRLVLDGRSAPLDAYAEPTTRPETEVRLPDGALVVLFTDGLIERVDRSLTDGLEAIVGALETRRDMPAQRLADELTEAMVADRRTKDDVCVVVLRLRAPG